MALFLTKVLYFKGRAAAGGKHWTGFVMLVLD
jgi:hypothetical protein